MIKIVENVETLKREFVVNPWSNSSYVGNFQGVLRLAVHNMSKTRQSLMIFLI